MFSTMKYVYAVYTEKSFSKAAQKLFISQPALSAMIKKTEERLGVQLFDRTGYPVELTDAGRIYMEAAQKVMALEKETQNYFYDSAAEVRGTIKIGGPNALFLKLIPHLTARFLQQYPDVEIQCFELSTAQLKEKVLAEELDLYFDIGRFQSDVITGTVLGTQQIFLAVSRQAEMNGRFAAHPRQQKDGIVLTMLQPQDMQVFDGQPLLFLTAGNDIHTRGSAFLKKMGVQMPVRMYFDQMATSYRFAKENLGVCFVGDTIVQDDSSRDNMCFYTVADDLLKRDIYIGVKKRRYCTAAMKAFLAFSQKRFGDAYRETQVDTQANA